MTYRWEKAEFDPKNSDYQIYIGIDGRRRAVVDFLDKAHSFQEPQALLLISQEDISWLTGDSNFLQKWQVMLGNILSAGHNITIAHTFERDPAQLIAIMSYWMPLHLTGRLNSYLQQRYEYNGLKYTLFIIKGVCALFSCTPVENNHDYITLSFTSSDTVAVFENMYYGMIKECVPLYDVHALPFKEGQKLPLDALNGSSGDLYAFWDRHESIMMPPALYEKILSRVEKNRTFRKNQINAHELYHQRMLRQLETAQVRILLFSSIESDDSPVTFGDSFIVPGRKIEVYREEYIEYTLFMIQLLRRYNNLRLVISNQPEGSFHPFHFNLILRDGRLALIMTPSEWEDQVFLVCREPSTLSALKLFYEKLWHHMSAQEKDIRHPDAQWEIFNIRIPPLEHEEESINWQILTPREAQITKLLLEGYSTKEIADREKISLNTVKTHIKNIYRKMGCASRIELIRMSKP